MTRLRQGRKISGLTLGQGARLLDVEVIHLANVELEVEPASDQLLRRMAELYQTTVAWLLGDEPQISPENHRLLNDVEHDSDRATLTEFMGMLSTPERAGYPPPRKARTIADIARLFTTAAEHDQSADEAAAELIADGVDVPGFLERVQRDVSAASKRRYVQHQGQTRNHECHWPGCTAQVPPAMWGCKVHWFRLPKVLRDRIWAAYVPGQEVEMTPSETYLQVADDVQRWIRTSGTR